ncbi:MAG: Trp biosynthesis-associated membrane protein [Nocardioides sp.]
MTDTPDRRPTFGPVVLLGVAAGALGAVAASFPWVVDGDAAAAGDPVPGIVVTDPVAAAGEMPLALALSLVVLAAWGVVLVSRGRLRRAVAAIGLLASAGLVATVVVGLVTLEDRVSAAVLARGHTSDVVATELTAWFFAAAVAALASVVAAALAVAWAPAWPEMGRRYDAPGAAPAEVSPEERSNLDLWKSMDEGHDPTA